MYEITQWLQTYREGIGMTPASAITTVFGAFAFTFVASICWGKLTEDFKAAGGFMAAAIIVGTFWILNHKLPGWGIKPEMHLIEGGAADGMKAQFGMVHQAYGLAGPWIDMGCAVAVGFWVGSIVTAIKGVKTLPHVMKATLQSLPLVLVVILGGLVGGAIVGLIGYSGAAFP